jgi:chloride channel 7
MGKYVMFLQPVEKVGVIYDFLKAKTHSVYPVVDKDDGGVLYGTIDKHALVMLLKLRAFGKPDKQSTGGSGVISNYLEIYDQRFVAIPGYSDVERSYPKNISVKDVRISQPDRELVVDLRPYTNQSPISIQESASVAVSACACFLGRFNRDLAPRDLTFSSTIASSFFQRTYELFRTMGLRFLPVVNRHNKIVGTITRADLTPEELAATMLLKGKKHI